MSAFDTFLKKKKGKKGQEEKPKKEAPKPPKKPTKKEVAKKREELGAEVVSEEAAEAIIEHEASEEKSEDRREDAAEEAEKAPDKPPKAEKKAAKAPTPPKPPKPPTPPKPAAAKETSAKPSAPAPSSGSTPSAEYTAEELQKAVQISEYGADLDTSTYGGKESITVVGDKGGGKTTLALAFPGKKLVISYDRMAIRNKYKMRDPENIKVIDPMTLYDASSPLRKRNSMVKIFDYLVGVEEYPDAPREGGLLDTEKLDAEKRPDYVIHDGVDILIEICEMVMRHRYDLLPAQGVEWNWWKVRKDAIQDVYHKSLTLAKKGVIYTTYFTDKQFDKDITGMKTTKELPKWMDIILHQTLHTFAVSAQGENFFLFVHQSKSVKKDVTKQTFDITGVSFESDEVNPDTKEKLWKMDFTKLYDVVEKIVREVF